MNASDSFSAATSGAPLTAGSAGELPAASCQALVDGLPWGVLVLAPDGAVTYLNAAAAALWGVPLRAVVGRAPAQVQPAVLPAALLAALREPAPAPADYWLPHTQQWVALRQAPAPDGQRRVFWDNVTARHQAEAARQITARKQAEQALRETKDLLQATLDSSHYAVQVFQAVRDSNGTIVDFTWLFTNQVWLKHYGAPMTGKRLLQENPGVVETGLFQLFVQVTETGVPVDHEQYYAHEQFKAWFHQTLVRMGDGFVMNTVDITERKQAQEEIISLKEQLAQQALDRYYSLFRAMDEGVSILEMLYDDHGQPVDMRWVEVNPAFERITGLTDVAGKRTSAFVPTEQYWLEAYDSVVKTGKALRYENYHAGIRQWYRTHTSRIGGPGSRIVANVFEDITEHKRHEAQLRQAAEAETFRLQLADALGPLADAGAIQEAVTRLARQHFAADRCYYCEMEDGQAIIRRDAATEGLPSVAGTYPLADFALLQAVIEAGRPFSVRDVRQQESVDENLRQLCVQLQVISYLDVPVIKNGQSVGVLCLVQSTPREWTAAETALAVEVAERTWAAVEHARAEEALRASEEKYRTLFDSIDEGFALEELVYDDNGEIEDIIFREVNRAYERQGGLTNVVGKSIKEVLPRLEPHWKEVYAQVARTGQSVRLINYAQDVNRWFNTYITLLAGSSRYVAVIFNDITERKHHEQRQAFLLQLSDALRAESNVDAVASRALALLSEQLGLDRCYITTYYADENRAAVDYQLGNDRVAPLPDHFVLSDYSEAYKTTVSHTIVIEDNVERLGLSEAERRNSAQLGMRAMVGATLRKKNQPLWSLVAINARPRRWTPGEISLVEEVAERTWVALERARTQGALAASEQRLRALIANLPGAAAFVVGADLRYQLAGGEALDAAGLGPADLLGRTLAEAMPAELVPQYEAHYRQALAGQSFSLEHPAHGRTFISRGVPLPGAAGQPEAVLVVSYDITARKQAEAALREAEERYRAQLEQQVRERTQELQQSRDLLQSVFDTSLISLSVLYAERDEAGQVQNFRFGLVNKELERETGRTDLVGKSYAQEYPGIRQVGVFDLMLRTLATGEPQGMEYYYEHEGFGKWFACQFVQLGDGLVATNLDITKRRTAEQERLRNLRLLEQAEAIAGLGSWDYDLATGTMRWSAGMYQLVNLPLGQAVSPDIYLQLVVEDDRPRAEQLVRQLTAGQRVEATLRLRVGEQVKTVRLQAVVLRDEAGQPVRALGVDLDISELRRLEADNLHLRLSQQQALFEAVQEAQEEERKRLAESLHNGIGQILYATKLRLDQLHALDFSGQPTLLAARREAEQFLSDAIRQTRALSHELVPLVLEEFGLAASFQGLGTRMSSPQLHLRTHVQLDEEAAPLPSALQLALYRMAQELAQNIVKHAQGATEASLELETTPGWVLLRAEDNGPGFAPASPARPGLGLRSIRDRVALLGGQLEADNFAAGGAYVRIRLPLPPDTPAP